ncbi:hypothetical protein ACW9HW_12220 [Pseudomonas sp. SDO5532_S415]
MADNSLEDLLAWMRDASPMLRWDSIFALEGTSLNLDLQQDYIRRLSQDNDLGAISVQVPVKDTNITHYLSGVKLAEPKLSYDNASLQSYKTDLRLAVVTGNLAMVELVQGQKRIVRLSSFNPLNGPQLRLKLPLEADSRSVVFDLAKSEDVLLMLFNTPAQQREAGMLFLERFKALGDNQRVHTLATFPEGDNPFMHSQRIDVRTQKRDNQAVAPQADNEDGALLVFQRMKEGSAGDFPGDDSRFRYLIPDATPEKNWTGTAMFSQALIHRAAFGHAVLKMFDKVQFVRENDWTGRLTKMVAVSGEFQAPAGSYQSRDYQFEYDPFSLSAMSSALPLTVKFDEDRVTQSWQSNLTLSFRLRPAGGAWARYTAIFKFDLEHHFRFHADDFSELGMEGELFTPHERTQEVTHVSGLPDTLDPELLERINDFVAQTVKRALLGRFANSLSAISPTTFLEELRIVDKSILQPTDSALPYDLAKFGQVQASGSSFAIVPQQSLVAAGKTLQLSTEPDRQGLRWTAENLPGSSSHPGDFIAPGLYKAAPVHAIQGTFNRVLVIAKDEATGEQSLAVITVLTKAITVNPQIQTCFHGERVELSGEHTGKGPLTWSIKNAVPGESGELVLSDLPDGDRAYIAGDQVPNKTYVLDEIEVSDSAGKEAESAWVLAIQQEPGATITIVDEPSLPPGQIQLKAFVNNNPVPGEWSLPLDGPGSIDEWGVYTDDPLSKEPFVLIFVKVDGGELGVFEGHIILPLPLDESPAVLKALAE